MLKKQKDHLLKKIEREKIAHALPDVSIRILNLAKEHGRVTVSFVTNVLQINRNTVKKHLQYLVRTEKLITDLLLPVFDNSILSKLHDGAVVEINGQRLG